MALDALMYRWESWLVRSQETLQDTSSMREMIPTVRSRSWILRRERSAVCHTAAMRHLTLYSIIIGSLLLSSCSGNDAQAGGEATSAEVDAVARSEPAEAEAPAETDAGSDSDD